MSSIIGGRWSAKSKDDKKLKQDFELTKSKADSGDPIAQYNLGVKYRVGRGVEPNFKLAMEWFHRAAENGHAKAQYNLGVAARYQGNNQEAFEWFSKSAEQGDSWAQYNLGMMHFLNEVQPQIPPNIQSAQLSREWFNKSKVQGESGAQQYIQALDTFLREEKRKEEEAQLKALQEKEKAEKLFQREKEAKARAEHVNKLIEKAKDGDAESQFELAIKYQIGEDVFKNTSEAFKLLGESAKQNNPKAQYYLGVMYQNGEGVSKDEKIASEYFEKAREKLQKSAEEDDASAQNILGEMYAFGHGVIKNEKLACEWYQKAALQENANAQCNLGLMCANGFGVTKDEKVAYEWYKKAAAKGNTRSQRNLGLMYEKGFGVPIDNEKAFEGYQKAALRGFPIAQVNLAIMYRVGKGTQKDENLAFEWYQKAAEQENEIGQFNLGWMYETGCGVTKNEKLAFVWYQKSALQGYAPAQNNIGCMFRDGTETQRDPKLACEWFQKAAEQGNLDALCNLGLMYEDVFNDMKSAAEWYKRSAAKENPVAQNNLAILYRDGKGLIQNNKLAFEWCQKSALQGYAKAQSNLGWMYANGRGVAKSEKLAFEWYEKAAKQGDVYSQYNLGKNYEFGRGVTKNMWLASEWYKKAAVQGHSDAQCNLGWIYEHVYNNQKLAAEWYEKSALNGNPMAQFNLGVCYKYGRGVLIDPSAAYFWFKKAAEQNYDKAREEANLIQSHYPQAQFDLNLANYFVQQQMVQKHGNFQTSNVHSARQIQQNSQLLQHVQQPIVPAQEIKIIKEQIIVDNASQLIPYSEITLGDLLGKGSYGEVFKANWRHATVAVKKFLLDKPSEDIVKDFVSEFQTMSKLKSPNIVQFYGYCSGPYCIVMEYMPQGSLYHVLHDKKKNLEQETILKIARDMSYGLAFLHKAKIVHRDIKSLNILLGEGNTAKFTDFGLATIKNSTATTTKNKGVAGTYAWMAPELALGDEGCTMASDVYSFGVTLWELSSRDIPFKKVAKPELIPLRASQGLRDEIPKECPKKLAKLITACWEGDPKKRPNADSIAEFWKSKQEDFRQFLPQYISSKIQSGELLDNLHSEQVDAADPNAANSQGLSGLIGNLAS